MLCFIIFLQKREEVKKNSLFLHHNFEFIKIDYGKGG